MKRACQLIVALCLLILFSGPVNAQHSGLYVGGLLGGNVLMSTQGTDSEGSFNLKFNPALQGSAVIGYDFAPGNPEGEGRIELEYSHRGNRLDKVQFVEGSFTGGGNLNADSLLINFFGVFHNDTQWAPYVGAGIGAARLDASDLKVTGQPLSSDSAYVLAYQFGAGVDYPLTDRLNLDLGYRFLGSTRPTFIEATGLKFRMDYYSHSVILGLRVGF